jgi:hypothetical protein
MESEQEIEGGGWGGGDLHVRAMGACAERRNVTFPYTPPPPLSLALHEQRDVSLHALHAALSST